MHKYRTGLVLAVLIENLPAAVATAQTAQLEEIVVTATKRESSLQDTPLAITAITAGQMADQGIFGVDDFRRGSVPSLTLQTLPINPATLQLTIRGIGNLDVSEMTRESPVAIYVDGVYLGRAQGLASDLTDLERIEILRGPQGTLFGRNAVGGALSFISRKPTGQLGLSQTLSTGNYGLFRSVTHLDLPEIAKVSTKVDIFKYSRDGFVKNTLPGSHDFSELDKSGGRFSLRWRPADDWTIDYAYDLSYIKNTTDYGVFTTDPGGLVGGPEPGRATHSRLPTPFLDPGKIMQRGHQLTLDWAANELLDIKLISSHRDLSQHDRTNFEEAFDVGWYSPAKGNSIHQDQTTHELQFVGKTPDASVEYAAGLFYFKENTEERYVGNGYEIPDFTNSFPGLHLGNTLLVSSAALLGVPSYPAQFINGYVVGLTGNPALYDPTLSDARHIVSDARSTAAYAQATWTPQASGFDRRLHLTAGVRENHDKKSGRRPMFQGVPTTDSFDLDQKHFDYAGTVAWDWSEAVNTYIRYATAYLGGGVNIRSASFGPYRPEVAKSTEVGFKSELFDKRVRLNAATFYVKYYDQQLDFLTPAIQTETINASDPTKVYGLELELTGHVTDNFRVNVNYSYTQGHLPLEPNTTAPGAPLTKFALPETPKHAGSVSANYTVGLPMGELNFFGEVDSRSNLYLTTGSDRKTGGYTLLNGRISWSKVALGPVPGKVEVSLWGYNLANRLYNAVQFSSPPTLVMGQNEPRTVGLDVKYDY